MESKRGRGKDNFGFNSHVASRLLSDFCAINPDLSLAPLDSLIGLSLLKRIADSYCHPIPLSPSHDSWTSPPLILTLTLMPPFD